LQEKKKRKNMPILEKRYHTKKEFIKKKEKSQRKKVG